MNDDRTNRRTNERVYFGQIPMEHETQRQNTHTHRKNKKENTYVAYTAVEHLVVLQHSELKQAHC